MLEDSKAALKQSLSEHQELIKDKEKKTKQLKGKLDVLLGKMKELDTIIARDTSKADTLLQTKQELEIKNQELYSTM